MPNVKPGDLARVVADPEGLGTLGMQVAVIGVPGPQWAFILSLMPPGLHYWEVQSLEMRALKLALSNDSIIKPKIIKAGEMILLQDRVLRRIDPPADSSDLYSTEPLPGEKVKDHVPTT